MTQIKLYTLLILTCRILSESSFSGFVFQVLYLLCSLPIVFYSNSCIILDANPLQEHYDNFFEDVFVECEDKYGPVEEMNVCDNLGDHLVGNVYVKFKKEEDADKAVKDLNNRWFGGRPIYAELTPVTDFREACCR